MHTSHGCMFLTCFLFLCVCCLFVCLSFHFQVPKRSIKANECAMSRPLHLWRSILVTCLSDFMFMSYISYTCILASLAEAIKNWTVGRPGNKATCMPQFDILVTSKPQYNYISILLTVCTIQMKNQGLSRGPLQT